MRDKNRMPFVLDKLNIQWNTRDEILDVWKDYPDQRLFQLLENYFPLEIYNEVSKNFKEFFWYEPHWNTEDLWGILTWDELIWTSRLDKNKKVLDKPVTRQIKDLETEHMLSIINEMYLSNEYLKVFLKTLNERSVIFSEKEIEDILEKQKELHEKYQSKMIKQYAAIIDSLNNEK